MTTLITAAKETTRLYNKNIGTQSVQEFFFCDMSICRTVYSNDLLKFFWLKLGIYDVHKMLYRQW